MGTPTYYSWKDTGGPGRNLTVGATRLQQLKQILKACLVDGYSGKAAAGWSMVHDFVSTTADSGFSMKPASGAGIINLVQPLSNGYLYVYLAETAATTGQALITGENVWSGSYNVGGNAGTRHTLYVGNNDGSQANLNNLRWFVVADAETFIIFMTYQSADTNRSTNIDLSLYCGRYINSYGFSGAAEFVALGGNLSTTPNYEFATGYTLLRNPLTGLILTGAGFVVGGAPFNLLNITSSAPDYSGSVLDTINLTQPRLFANTGGGSGCYPGRLRGVAYDDLLTRADVYCSQRALGQTLGLGTLGDPITIGGVPIALCAYAATPRFFTTHADFW